MAATEDSDIVTELGTADNNLMEAVKTVTIITIQHLNKIAGYNQGTQNRGKQEKPRIGKNSHLKQMGVNGVMFSRSTKYTQIQLAGG